MQTFLPKNIPLSNPSPMPGKREDIIIIIAGAVAPTVPAPTAGPTAIGRVAAPPAPAAPAAAPPVEPPPTATDCSTDTRGPMRLVKAGISGSGDGIGEPREMWNKDRARRKTWTATEL